jgi:hypothetical protein
MTTDVNYFIKVKDHINKSDRIVNKVTSLDTYVADFYAIINFLNRDHQYSVTQTNGEAELTKSETVTVPGYIYNSTKTVITPAYSLSLIKIDSTLSDIFQTEFTDKETQTIVKEDASDIQTKETQSENELNTENKDSQTVEITETVDIEEFGEFQSCSPEYVNVDLSENSYPYCNNVIVPPYNPYNYCNSYNSYNPSYTSYNSSYNPFTNIMNLRGDNEDVHFTFGKELGSKVPSNPTQTAPTWAPELISELKFRLAQPNAGLLSNNSTYFL